MTPAPTTKVPDDEALANLQKIDHIVILMMENRSFDHMLGFLSIDEGRTEVDGPTPDLSNTHAGQLYPIHQARSTKLVTAQDPCHTGWCVDEQLANTNGGFVSNYVKTRQGRLIGNPGVVMAYHTKEQLPVYAYLADEFCVCDRWFSSVAGATMPNRCYAVAGTSGGARDNNSPPRLYNFASFPRHLQAAKVSWRWYSHDFVPMLWMIDPAFGIAEESEPAYFDRPSLFGHRSFIRRARENDLPSVSWIDPNFVDLTLGPAGSNDDHPPTDLHAGQKLVLEIFHALVRSRLWPKTMLIITYDEHGGFYDHVAPPAAEDDSPSPQLKRYGPRVPALVISPLVGKRQVSSTVFDHTSIIKTILARFCRKANGTVPDMGARVRAAAHLGELLTEPAPRAAQAQAKYQSLLDKAKQWQEQLNHEGASLHLEQQVPGAAALNDLQKYVIHMKAQVLTARSSSRELLAVRAQLKQLGITLPKA